MNALIHTLKLYEIGTAYLEALEVLTEADDLPPEAIADTLEGLAGTFEMKATAIAAFIRNLELEAAAVEDAKRRMEQRQRALQNHADRMRQYLKFEMERTGIVKVKSAELALRIQKNPHSTIVDDESQVPDEFKETIVTVKVLRAEIGKALKAGQAVPGAHREQATRLVIQ